MSASFGQLASGCLSAGPIHACDGLAIKARGLELLPPHLLYEVVISLGDPGRTQGSGKKDASAVGDEHLDMSDAPHQGRHGVAPLRDHADDYTGGCRFRWHGRTVNRALDRQGRSVTGGDAHADRPQLGRRLPSLVVSEGYGGCRIALIEG